MMDERFSLRYGYEVKPEHPIFDEAPKRLRFFIIKSFQMYLETHRSVLIIAEALCRSDLITGITTPRDVWDLLFPIIEKRHGWEIYNLIETLYAELKTSPYSPNPHKFEVELNQLFGEESIGWRLEDGKLAHTLPVAAREQVDAVFKELGNPRFAPALAHIIAAYKAYNAQPQRGLEVCSNAYDACESVAKEIFGLPTATFGDVLKEARSKKKFGLRLSNVPRGDIAVRAASIGNEIEERQRRVSSQQTSRWRTP